MGFDLLCMGDQGLTIGQSALNKSQGKQARPGHSPGFFPATTGWNVHSFSNQTRWTPNFSVEFDNDSLSRLSELNESHLRFGHKMVSLEDSFSRALAGPDKNSWPLADPVPAGFDHCLMTFHLSVENTSQDLRFIVELTAEIGYSW